MGKGKYSSFENLGKLLLTMCSSLPNATLQVKPHNDAEYGHQNGELNMWIPLTDRSLTGVDLWSESSFKKDDYHPVPADVGEVVVFHGSSCRHYVNANASKNTRVSLDFRIGVEGFFDPYWQMKGTTDDHGRREATL
jgi:ectoine hydroxylase-related dioxygenase (phytanoyl-CoA dioxygenase family)